MRINEAKAMAKLGVLGRQIEQQGGFARPGLAQYVEMQKPVRQMNAKGLGQLIASMGKAQD